MPSHADLLETLPAAVVATDRDGRIVYRNAAAADLLRGSAEGAGTLRLRLPDGQPVDLAQAVTLACADGTPARGLDVLWPSADGAASNLLLFAKPLTDPSGERSGMLCLLVPPARRADGEITSAQLAAIVASSDDAIVSKTVDGVVTTWNAGAARIFGYGAAEMVGQPIFRIIPPELHAEEREILARLRRGEHVQHYETVRLARDGRRVDISLSVSPLHGPSGEVVGASKVGRDITGRKAAERAQRLLLEELNHRVRNTLATVQAIASLSARHSTSARGFVASFTGRVQALATAHSLLADAAMQGARVGDLVREQVVLGEEDKARITCAGPRLIIDAQAAVRLAMILHELASNARLHGALSVPTGRLAIEWELSVDGCRALLLRWRERGVPAVRAPAGSGFGTSLIEQTLKSGGGEAQLSYGGDGVTAEIRLPLADHEPGGPTPLALPVPPHRG